MYKVRNRIIIDLHRIIIDLQQVQDQLIVDRRHRPGQVRVIVDRRPRLGQVQVIVHHPGQVRVQLIVGQVHHLVREEVTPVEVLVGAPVVDLAGKNK